MARDALGAASARVGPETTRKLLRFELRFGSRPRQFALRRLIAAVAIAEL